MIKQTINNIARFILLTLTILFMGCSKHQSNQDSLPSACSRLLVSHVKDTRDSPQLASKRPSSKHATGPQLPIKITARVVATHPHRGDAFTQGLIYDNEKIYESTGRYGQSTLSHIDLQSGKLLMQHKLDVRYFGEGLARVDQQLFQLTWKSGEVLIYDLATLTLKSTINIGKEAWGLSSDGEQLIMSDGSAQLHWLDPHTLRLNKHRSVTVAGRPLNKLNELEWVDGCILANIWYSDELVFIDAESGFVEYTLNLASIANVERRKNKEHVANGIAYMPETGHLLVTGKNWQHIYQLQLM